MQCQSESVRLGGRYSWGIPVYNILCLNSVLFMMILNWHGVTWIKGKSSKCRLGEEQACISTSYFFRPNCHKRLVGYFVQGWFLWSRVWWNIEAAELQTMKLSLIRESDTEEWGVMQASVETTKEKQLHNTWVNRIFLQMSHSLLWSKWYQD